MVAKFGIPLGMETVPDSTRRDQQARHAREMADLLLKLSDQFGADQVQEVLALDSGDGQPLIAKMADEYGEEVMQRALALFSMGLQTQGGTPADSLYLPA